MLGKMKRNQKRSRGPTGHSARSVARGLARQGIAPLDVPQLQELLEVVGEGARVLAGLLGDGLDGGVSGGQGREDGVVEGDLAQLFAQQEVGLV